MNKYFKYYYLDSLLIFALTMGLVYYTRHDMFVETFLYSLPPLINALIWISGIAFFFIVTFNIGGYKFYESKQFFPKLYLLFFIIVISLGALYYYLFAHYLLFAYYYYSLLYVGYSLLTIYTLLGFKKDKKKNK